MPDPGGRGSGASAVPAAPTGATAADRFARARLRFHGALPAWLARLVPETAIGFAAISSFTYAVDLTILYVLDSVLGVLYPVAVTVGYVIAFGLAFVLNRWLNFQSHGPVGRQTGRYVLTVLTNYALFILGLASLLEWQGVPGIGARLIAGAFEAVYMYLMMRFFVFRIKRYA
ncbi:GtrA family protein [Ornithinimicrobium flavum]|uniref:GtrA family protein n=1 Tax=Ornithinimicrobium flavum TaxID=1288636 RepID=UPI001EE87606|nr:GtrA family protein [Ornithinimicrobium flavum]